MIKEVLKTIKRYGLIQSGDRVVVGVSGGPDSVCLLHVLHSLADELNMKNLYAVHINHMLRGEEAYLDEQYVADLCQRLKVQLFTKRCDIRAVSKERGISLEEAGREARYEEFRRIIGVVNGNKIAVAHNKNDQAETILLNIIRGTGLEGLRGMEHMRGAVVRPLMDVGRKDIEAYCEDKGLSPRIDSSNLENIYTRNKVRLELIPYIDNLFQTDITEKLLRTSSILKEDNDYIEQNVIYIYNQCVKKMEGLEVQLDLTQIKRLHRSMQKRILRNAIKDVKGHLKGIENIHIEDTLNIIKAGKTGAELHLPHEVRVRKSYDSLRIYLSKRTCDAAKTWEEQMNLPGETAVTGCKAVVKADILPMTDSKSYLKGEQSSFVQFFDWHKVEGGLKIRQRMEGDIFKPFRSNGTKKLKEYFIDNKIPKEERDKIPLVAKDKEIVWIIGHKISDKFKVTENTKSVLKLEYKTSEENT